MLFTRPRSSINAIKMNFGAPLLGLAKYTLLSAALAKRLMQDINCSLVHVHVISL